MSVAIAGFAWWLHRTGHGRSLYAIGHSAEGARYAGISVTRRLGLLYVLSGLLSGLAVVIYVAHLGQAKADAGTGFELMAITAVVLGGASIFGGRGGVLGTVLGLLAIVVLQNGLRLSGQPAELAGILTGTLLVATILLDRLTMERGTHASAEAAAEEVEVKNSQVAVLCAVILAAALVVVLGNWWLLRSVRQDLRGLVGSHGLAGRGSGGEHRPVIAMMPKAKGDPYFISCRKRGG
jgi:rhamnose transport system permease protein